MKVDKEGLRILAVLTFLICILVCILINAIRVHMIRYKWFKGEETGISRECYVDDRGCMCKIDGGFIWVDSYYEITK